MAARLIDFDANATTALSGAAQAAMAAAMAADLGNPSSVHRRGQRARAQLEAARREVAAAIGGGNGTIVWTSGATEANALAWHGLLAAPASAKASRRAVTSPVEHPSIRALAVQHAAGGLEVVDIPVDAEGRLDLAGLERALAKPTALVSLMAVQNELGVVYPLAEIAALVHANGALLHCDATQAIGRIPFDCQALDLDAASVSAHKVGGPSGIGALWLRRGLPLTALVPGHQEDGLRGGTENLLGAVGMAAAYAEVPARLAGATGVRQLRDALWQEIQRIGPVRRNGDVAPRDETGHVLSVSWPGIDGARLVRALDLEGICVAAGAACASGTQAPSHVLLACGRTRTGAREAVRFSLGTEVTADDVSAVVTALPPLLARVRQRR